MHLFVQSALKVLREERGRGHEDQFVAEEVGAVEAEGEVADFWAVVEAAEVGACGWSCGRVDAWFHCFLFV